MNPIQQAEALTLRAARELMERGAELDATEQVLRAWAWQTEISWGSDREGLFILIYHGWYSKTRFNTFHEMLVVLLGLIGTDPKELARKFQMGDI